MNWKNLFGKKTKPNPVDETGVHVSGPGSKNVKVVNLSGYSGAKVVIGSQSPINQKINTEIPMYGQSVGFIPVQAQYRPQSSFQVPSQPQYQATSYQVPFYQPSQTSSNQSFSPYNTVSSNLYTNLGQQQNPFLQNPTEYANTQAQTFNPYVKEPVKGGNQSNEGKNPYY